MLSVGVFKNLGISGFLSKEYPDFLCLLCIEKVSSHQMGSYLESDPLSVYPHVLNNRTLVLFCFVFRTLV